MNAAIQKAINDLNELGVDGIRLRFKSLGIKGLRKSPSYCVISNYLKRLFPEKQFQTVPGEHGYILCVQSDEAFDIPVNVSNFATFFDNSGAPELISS